MKHRLWLLDTAEISTSEKYTIIFREIDQIEAKHLWHGTRLQRINNVGHEGAANALSILLGDTIRKNKQRVDASFKHGDEVICLQIDPLPPEGKILSKQELLLFYSWKLFHLKIYKNNNMTESHENEMKEVLELKEKRRKISEEKIFRTSISDGMPTCQWRVIREFRINDSPIGLTRENCIKPATCIFSTNIRSDGVGKETDRRVSFKAFVCDEHHELLMKTMTVLENPRSRSRLTRRSSYHVQDGSIRLTVREINVLYQQLLEFFELVRSVAIRELLNQLLGDEQGLAFDVSSFSHELKLRHAYKKLIMFPKGAPASLSDRVICNGCGQGKTLLSMVLVTDDLTQTRWYCEECTNLYKADAVNLDDESLRTNKPKDVVLLLHRVMSEEK